MINKYRLLEKIANAGYTQSSLAKKMNMSKNTLNSTINGKSYFDTKQIDDLCEILGITSDQDKIRIFLASSSQIRDKAFETNPA